MLAMSMLGSRGAEGEGSARRTSERRRVWISGWVAMRWVAQVKADEVVSCLELSVT
jgi:hypothetical protein